MRKDVGMMSSAEPFVFAADFVELERQAEEAARLAAIPMISIDEHEKRSEEARQGGYEHGVKDGAAQALASLEAKISDLVEIANGQLADLIRSRDADNARIEAQSADLALIIGQKIAGELIARQPDDLIESVIRSTLTSLRRKDCVVIRVAPSLADALGKRLDPIRNQTGFEGKLLIEVDEAVLPGNSHIEWNDGGIIHDRQAICGDIAKCLAEALGEDTKSDGSDFDHKDNGILQPAD